MRIILDTNFIIYALQCRVRIEEELRRILDVNFEIFVIQQTLDELKKLKNSLALKYAGQFPVIKEEGYADDVLKKLSNENTIIATMDRNLQMSLKRKIIIRQKKYLALSFQ